MNPTLSIPIDRLAEYCRARGMARLAIFGSALRSDFGPASDIDLLVEFESGRTPGLLGMVGMEQEFPNLFARNVDWSNVPPSSKVGMTYAGRQFLSQRRPSMRRDDAYLFDTVEAVPAPMVKSVNEIVNPHPHTLPEGEGATSSLPSGEGGRRPDEGNEVMADQSIGRSDETLRQEEWHDELQQTGIRGKQGQRITFSQVALAFEEAHNLVPKPRIIGQPDVQSKNIAEGDHAGKFRVSVHDFDYFNTKTGNVESGDADNVATWMLDPDCDGRSLFPCQVFFLMADAKDVRTKLARHLKAKIDTDLIEAYRGTVSLPFEPDEHGHVAVKIADDWGVESLKVIQLTQTERG